MDEAAETLSALGALIEEWRRAPAVLELTRELVDELRAGTTPFVGRPLPDDLVRGRLRAPVASAWVFVLRPRTRNPAHLHPSSTQYTAAIAGGGTCYVGDEARELEPFDRARIGRTLLVIPAGTPHAFEPGAEPLVVLSFHSVTPEELVEIEVESGAVRGYVGDTMGEASR
jgi:quercetin dioxygenase-like cupin family protein